MRDYVSATFADSACRHGVCVVDGYGVRVRVNRRHLVVSDGIGRHRRERVFTKAFPGIKRLMVIGHEGFLTLDALRWLSDAGVAFLQLDRDGALLASSDGYGLNDARLRRALALAPSSRSGLEIARYLLSVKLAGQARVLSRAEFAGPAAGAVASLAEAARNALSVRNALRAEADGALTYWNAWANVQICFARKDVARVPDQWRTFGQRSSPLTGSPRLAANPANAMLNYLYALLEAETRVACLACGLDPGLGVFHADQKSRDSLVCDVMEAARPAVDEYLLDLLAVRTFSLKDFTETRTGVCRVLAPLTHTLAETTGRWAKAIAPVVETVAVILAADSPSRIERLPTMLTQSNRSAGRDAVRRRPKKVAPEPRVRAGSCAGCGAPLASSRRRYCEECLPEHEQETLALLSEAGPAALARLRAEGRDPTKTEAAKKKVGQANSRRLKDAARWDADNESPDEAEFVEQILPSLQGVPLSRMMKATGLSLRYCSQIRRGRVPHARHWCSLQQLATCDD